MNQSGHSFSFPQKENLKGKKLIEELFKNGSSFYFHPLLVKVLPESDKTIKHNRVLFSVPKKKFKRAVDRNLLKRRMRESYRLNKPALFPPSVNQFYQIAFVYTDKSILPYSAINEKLIQALERLVEIDSDKD
ncbi:MAG: ribonuclease P protein component [Cyclobacteriaceae bacterium]